MKLNKWISLEKQLTELAELSEWVRGVLIPFLVEGLALARLDADEVVDWEVNRGVVEGGLGVVDEHVLRVTPRPVAVDIKGGHSTPKARKPVITSAIGQI